ncbi:MAG: FAD-dependent oxidoreductase [Thermodesulfobacteriota bacterium]
MRDQARVVVIGGGIFGASVAYHLASMGCSDVVLVEKGELTSGTTFHSVGLVSQFRTSPALMEVMNYTIRLFDQLKVDAGESLGWRRNGSLRLASSPDRLKALKREAGRAKAIGLNVDLVSPEEARRLFPYLSEEDLYGAVYIPDDGYIDPNGITTELAKRARKMGVEVRTQTRVTGLKLSPTGAVNQVETNRGNIKTEIVVNAAGQWAPRISRMVGVYTPLVPLMHQYITFKPIPGHEVPPTAPVVRDPDHLFYIREEVGGFLVGIFETNPKTWAEDGVPWEFTQQLLDPEWELVEPALEMVMRRVPLLNEAEVIQCVNGPDAFTHDGAYALGPVPGVKGFYLAAGGSINGIAGAGGVGKCLAEWILEGETSIDTHEMNVRRFGPHLADQTCLAARGREVYKYYYHLRYPLDENEWGRPGRTSPFYPRLKELGAVFGEKNGWERVNYFDPGKPWRLAGADQKTWGWGRPPYFDLVAQEAEATRRNAGLFDLTSFGKIEVRGPGALPFLQRLAANDLDRPVGAVTYTQFLNAKGGIESDLTVTRLGPDSFRLITGTAFLSNDLGWIKLHLPDDGSVEVSDVTLDWGCLGLWGPQARKVLQSVTHDDVSNQVFPYMTARAISIVGLKVLAQRTSYVGEQGWEIYVRPADALEVYDILLAAGREFGLRPAGYKALDSLRLEKGFLYWSGDITPKDNPLESGQGRFVKLDKGDFIGRTALLKIKERGLRTKMCPVVIEAAPELLYGGESVFIEGRLIGRLRSGGYGHTVKKSLGLVYLPVEMATPGHKIEVEAFGQLYTGVVAPAVLVDLEDEKTRA